MVFNSVEYFKFFAIIFLTLPVIPTKVRPLFLTLCGAYFYMSWKAIYFLILLGTSSVDFAAGVAMQNCKADQSHKRRVFLYLSLATNLGVLFFFKYYNFFIESFSASFLPELKLILPLGISFYTFQAMSYSIDVYRGDQFPEKNYLKFLAFVTYFPQLIAGPIERASQVMSKLVTKKIPTINETVSGLLLVSFGMFKKIVIADRAAIFVDQIYNSPAEKGAASIAIATLLFAYQIYCDFSGYTDIARGCSRLLGIELVKNFNFPYAAKSMSDFWSRWHISLSSWFRDYLYKPLGGNKKGQFRTKFNVMAVFLVSGLWHGANFTFLFWGMWHGLGVALSGKLAKIPLSTPLWVLIGWVFFRINKISDFSILFKEFYNYQNLGILSGWLTYDAVLLFTFILLLEGIQLVIRKREIFYNLTKALKNSYWLIATMASLFLIFTTIIFGEFRAKAFIYFQF